MAKRGRKNLYKAGPNYEVRVPRILNERLEAEARSMGMSVNTFLYCLISATVASPGPSMFVADKVTSVNEETLTKPLTRKFNQIRTDRPPMGAASLAHRLVGSYVRQSRLD